jgi:hypothetical protein
MHASALGLKHFRASGHEISATSIDPYLNVITAQTTLLSNQQTAVSLRRQQMTASVQLVEALGREVERVGSAVGDPGGRPRALTYTSSPGTSSPSCATLDRDPYAVDLV